MHFYNISGLKRGEKRTCGNGKRVMLFGLYLKIIKHNMLTVPIKTLIKPQSPEWNKAKKTGFEMWCISFSESVHIFSSESKDKTFQSFSNENIIQVSELSSSETVIKARRAVC